MLFHVGMLEKAVFFSEYNNININGVTSESIQRKLQNLIYNVLVDSLKMITLIVVIKCMENINYFNRSKKFYVYFK